MKYFNSLGFPPIYLLSAICYLYLLQFYCHAIFTSDPHDSATISTPPPPYAPYAFGSTISISAIDH
jgi:hypothetical protein